MRPDKKERINLEQAVLQVILTVIQMAKEEEDRKQLLTIILVPVLSPADHCTHYLFGYKPYFLHVSVDGRNGVGSS